MKKQYSKRRLHTAAILWTVAAILAGLTIAFGRTDTINVIVTLLFCIEAGIGWKQYIKKQQEE